MPVLNYTGVPTVEPAPTTGGNFQNIQAPASAFGAAQGQALEGLGQQFERAGDRLADVVIQRQQLFNQVAVDEASTKWRDSVEKLMYGDPATGTLGFNGLKGREAMDAYPQVRKQFADLLDDHRAQLQNPIQQHLFDRANSQARQFTISEMGRHYDRANNLWTESVQKGKSAQADQAMGRAAAQNNWPDFDDALQRKIESDVALAKAQGLSYEAFEAIKGATVEKAVAEEAQGLMLTDPIAARDFLKAHRGDLKDPAKSLALEHAVEDAAAKKEGENIRNGVPNAPGLVRGGAVEQRQGGATRNLPIMASVEEQLNQAASTVGGVNVEVISGGQPSSGPNRTGSHRHDEGGAADIQLRDTKTGQLLDMRKPADQVRMAAFITAAVASGATGVGAAEDYMGPHGIHVGGGTPAVWGAGGSSTNTPDWVRTAFEAGRSGANNLGGLRRAGSTVGPSQGGFQSFATPEQGVQATVNNLRKYGEGGVVAETNPSGKPLNTLQDIITTWAPPKENDTASLITRAVAVTGFKPDQVLDMKDPAVLAKVSEAMIRGEQGGRLPVPQEMIVKAAATKGGVDQLILPDREPGELPDDQVPGLQKELDRILADPRSREGQNMTKSGVKAYKEVRKEFNDAFANQQHARRLELQAQQDQDRAVIRDYQKRMTNDSSTYPTTDEIRKDLRLSNSAVEDLVGQIHRDVRPETDSNVSARNQRFMIARMDPDYTGADKITNEKQIRQAYNNGELTLTDRDKTINELYSLNDPEGKRWKTHIDQTFKAVEAKIVPQIIGLGHRAYNLDASAAPRADAWRQAVKAKIVEYQQAGKNPLDLFIPGTPEDKNPNYVGGEGFLARFMGTIGDRTKDTVPVPGTAPTVDLATKGGIEDAFKKGLIPRRQAEERLRQLGIPYENKDTREAPFAR